ncbi:MAG: hypothetical protein ACRCX2_04610, partial [Paraclostridium sp.]
KIENKLSDMNLEENVTTVGAVTYDSIQVSPTYNIGRMTENKALDRIDDETELKIELYRNKRLKGKIEKSINNLSPIHKDIIKYRYLEKLEWIDICEIMNYERTQLHVKKKEAIKSIAIELFGIKVFEEENYTLFNLLTI